MNDFTSIEKRVQRLTAEELDMDVMEMVCELKSLVCTLSHMLMTQSNQLAGLQAQLNTYMYGTVEPQNDITQVYPGPNKYNDVRLYVERRKATDQVFKRYCQTHSRKELCQLLSDTFGWVVNENHYGQNLNRHPQN